MLFKKKLMLGMLKMKINLVLKLRDNIMKYKAYLVEEKEGVFNRN